MSTRKLACAETVGWNETVRSRRDPFDAKKFPNLSTPSARVVNNGSRPWICTQNSAVFWLFTLQALARDLGLSSMRITFPVMVDFGMYRWEKVVGSN